jgi:deoxycytidylate deaminase
MAEMADIKPLRESEQAPDRIPLEEVYMRMAEELAKRSTCARLQVGTVIATPDLTQVLGIGYNGNARGLANRCDSSIPGACGCLHSEQNALIKAGSRYAWR